MGVAVSAGASWPAAMLAELRRLWPDPLLTCKSIGKQIGKGSSAVWCMAQSLGLPPKKRHSKYKTVKLSADRVLWPDDAVAELVRLWAQGLDRGAIAHRMERTPAQITNKARRLRLVPRKSNGAAPRRAVQMGRQSADNRPPLPPGHPASWGLLTAGTLLHGAAYTPPEPYRG